MTDPRRDRRRSRPGWPTEFGITMGDQRLAGGADDGRADPGGPAAQPAPGPAAGLDGAGQTPAADPRVIAGIGRLLGRARRRRLAGRHRAGAGSLGRRGRRRGVRCAIPAPCSPCSTRPARRTGSAGVLTFGFAETATVARASRRRPAGIGLPALHPAPGRLRAGHRRLRRAAFACHRPPAAARSAGAAGRRRPRGAGRRRAVHRPDGAERDRGPARHRAAGALRAGRAGRRPIAPPTTRSGPRSPIGWAAGSTSSPLVRGRSPCPAATVDRVAAELAAHEPVPTVERRSGPASGRWNCPGRRRCRTGGRHGFLDDDRDAFDAAVESAAAVLATPAAVPRGCWCWAPRN